MVCREWRERGGGKLLTASTAVWRTARCYMFLCWLLYYSKRLLVMCSTHHFQHYITFSTISDV